MNSNRAWQTKDFHPPASKPRVGMTSVDLEKIIRVQIVGSTPLLTNRNQEFWEEEGKENGKPGTLCPKPKYFVKKKKKHQNEAEILSVANSKTI